MARKFNVTSTIKVTYTTYKRYNTFTDEVEETTETNIPTFTTNTVQEQLKELRKVDFEACKPVSQSEHSALYGMEDDTFMRIAFPINADERRNLITRTVKSLKVSVMVYDKEDTENQFKNTVTYIDPSITSPDKMLATVRKQLETDTVKVVTILDSEVIENLFGCTKEAFVVNATWLDPITRKPYEN